MKSTTVDLPNYYGTTPITVVVTFTAETGIIEITEIVETYSGSPTMIEEDIHMWTYSSSGDIFSEYDGRITKIPESAISSTSTASTSITKSSSGTNSVPITSDGANPAPSQASDSGPDGSTSSTPASSSYRRKALPAGAIAGVVLAVLVMFSLITAALFHVRKRHHARRHVQEHGEDNFTNRGIVERAVQTIHGGELEAKDNEKRVSELDGQDMKAELMSRGVDVTPTPTLTFQAKNEMWKIERPKLKEDDIISPNIKTSSAARHSEALSMSADSISKLSITSPISSVASDFEGSMRNSTNTASQVVGIAERSTQSGVRPQSGTAEEIKNLEEEERKLGLELARETRIKELFYEKTSIQARLQRLREMERSEQNQGSDAMWDDVTSASKA
ncbi:MAG: hypothetical protein M1820_006936 [Bogoriella megaspora]|nr:MAG: hypothetical protein M1820_006936 [Bogoriella megaspora]